MDQLTKIWQFMDGKKTLVGATITILAYLSAGVPLAAAFCTTTVCATTVAKVSGVSLTVLGIAHRIYKAIYRENHD
jgi:hypothetical protein